MKRILVASDLSARSDRAVERAALLALQHSARVTILHVVDEELPAHMADRQSEDAHRSLMRAIAVLPASPAGSFEPRVVVGEHYQAVLAEAERVDADLIVIGQHRKDILLDLFRGSTGERIIRFGTRPVLVVKRRATHAYVRLLAAIDFSPPSRKAIETAIALAPGADLDLIHAVDIPFRGLLMGGSSIESLAKRHQQQFQDMVDNQTREFIASFAVPLRPRQTLIRDGHPAEVVTAVAEENASDLVVVGTHGRSGLGRALLGSVAESVLARATCDVLAVRGW